MDRPVGDTTTPLSTSGRFGRVATSGTICPDIDALCIHVDHLVRILLNGSSLMMGKYQRPSWMMKRYLYI